MGGGERMNRVQRCAGRRLILQIAQREGVEVSQEALQREVDEWRYRNRLEQVEDTEAWLSQRGVTLDDVAAEVACGLLEEALAGRVSEGRIEPHFAQHALDFDEAEVCWIHVSEEGVAEEIRMQVAEEGARFHELARRYSEDETTRPAGGYLGRLRLRHLPQGVAPLVFAARPGEVVGPVKVRKKYALYLAQEIFPATLTEAVREEIRGRLFNAWLKHEMRRAQIAFPILESPMGSETADVPAHPQCH